MVADTVRCPHSPGDAVTAAAGAEGRGGQCGHGVPLAVQHVRAVA